jgi:hypothetical protein
MSEKTLVELIIEADELARLIDHQNRATARKVLDALDARMGPGDERTQVRDILLKQLAHNKEEIERWLESQETLTDPLSAPKPSG